VNNDTLLHTSLAFCLVFIRFFDLVGSTFVQVNMLSWQEQKRYAREVKYPEMVNILSF